MSAIFWNLSQIHVLNLRRNVIMIDAEIFGFDISSIKTFSGYYLDLDKLKASSSGGAASAIAERFIMDGGVVFGVKYSRGFRSAEYCYAERPGELEQMKGSKYITSKKEVFINGKYMSVYKMLQDKLEQGNKVLFIGLGCDVGAAYRYLIVHGINTDKLYTIDLVCHGPTLPKVAEEFLDGLEKRYQSRVIDFTVRYKKIGWEPPFIRAVFESGVVYEHPFYETDYGKAFLIFPRSACLNCKFRGKFHVSDITVGDYWGMVEKPPEYNKYGVSILFLNNQAKAKKLIDLLDQQTFHLQEADTVRALKGNPNYYRCKNKPKNYDKFARDFEKQGLHYAVVHSNSIKTRIISRLKRILPRPLITVMKKTRLR